MTDNELTGSYAGFLKGNELTLKTIFKNLKPNWRFDYKESIWNYSNMTGKLHRTPTLCRNLKCYMDPWGNSNGRATYANDQVH